MRLLELEIHNVRGIPHLLLKPDGKNFSLGAEWVREERSCRRN